MNIGKLRERITFQSLGATDAGSFGSSNGTWTEVKTVFAQFQGLFETEQKESEQPVASTSAQFRIREPRDYTITTKMRIVFRSQNYYITGIRPANAGDHVIVTATMNDNG